jgi:hypothetical protein
MFRRGVWALLGMMTLSDGLLGCDLACDKQSSSDPARPYTGGRIEGGVYITNGWNEPFVEFDAGVTLSFEHGLGSEPEVFTWLSFWELPFADDKNASQSAGNQVVIEAVDSEKIVVRNDTCQDFYLRLVAIPRGEVTSSVGGQGGAGGSE